MRAPTELRDALNEFLVTNAAIRCGLMDRIAERPYNHKELARLCRLDRDATTRLLGAMAHFGLVMDTPMGVALAPDAKSRYGPGGSDRWMTMLFADSAGGLLHLPDVVRTGEPFTPPGDSPERLETWLKAQAERPRDALEAAADRFMDGLAAGARVLDVGGGPGHMARAFIERGATVTLLDLPPVVEALREEHAAIEGLEVVAGDATDALPAGPFDAVYLGNVTNMLSAEANAALVARIGSALAPGGRIGFQVYLGGHSSHGAMFRVLMKAYTERGDAWTLDDYASWCAAAGLGAPEVFDLDEDRVFQLVTAGRQ